MRPAPTRAEPRLLLWREMLHPIERALLQGSAVYWGMGGPRGDGSPVIVVPAFLSNDCHLWELRMWLTRMGYRVFCSGIGLNADCPYLLTCRVANTVEYAYRATHERVHLIGHSLGGLLARAVAVMLPNRVQSLITLGSPFRGIVAHPAILCAARWVRCVTLERRAGSVPWTCFRDDCRCTFVRSLRCSLAPSIRQTAIYTKLDGVVDWRYCITGDHRIDRAVTATHSGLIVNPEVYELLARRLALPAC